MNIYELSELIGSLKTRLALGDTKTVDQDLIDFYEDQREQLKKEIEAELAKHYSSNKE